MFPSFPHEKHCSQSPFLFSRCKLRLRYTAGNFNENPSMRVLAKVLRARASEHSSNFCEQFEQRLNFASTFKLDGTIRYPQLTLGDIATPMDQQPRLPYGQNRIIICALAYEFRSYGPLEETKTFACLYHLFNC